MSSLPPIAQQAYVCLQCRSRFAAIQTKAHNNLKKGPKKPQRRNFFTRPTSLQHFAAVDENESRNPNLFGISPASEKDISQDHDDIKLPNDCRPPTKLPYAFKRAHLYSKDELGVTTLGKPAEVLRLRDLPDRHKASKWWLSPNPDNKRQSSTEPLTASDILKRVNSERGLVSGARASQNIEQLKQEWLSSLENQDLGPTESECYELGRQLYEGFTTRQLSGYLGEVRIPFFRGVLDLNGPYKSTSFTRSKWRLGTTPFPGDAPQRLQSMAKDGKEQNIAPAHSASTLLAESRRSGEPFKHVQVNEIMQKCWNIKPREELNSPGEVDIVIPETHLELLASHKRNILQQLAAEYEAKIDFSKVESVIRLTANQATCTASLKLLLMVLEEITCYKMDLNEGGGPHKEAKDYQSVLNDDTLREIERLSSTVIRRSMRKHAAFPEPHKLLIYSMKSDKDSLDDAQRFLRQLCKPSRRSVTATFYGGRPVKSTKPNLVPIVGTVGLPVTERGTEWNRISTTSDEKETRARAQYYPSEALNGIWKHLANTNGELKVNKHYVSHPHWHTSPYQESSVVVGRVLYPAETMTSIKRERYFLDTLNKRHVFDTDVPSLTRALEAHSARTVLTEEFRVRLTATNTTDVQGNQDADLPDLEIRFSIHSKGRDVVPQSVRMILKDRQADLLSPHESTDLRFATQMYLEATSNLDHGILDFIEKCEFDVYRVASMLETPARLTIGIPQRLLPSNTNPEGSEDAEVLTDYTLAGVERHHILRSCPDQRHQSEAINFSFSIVDAGPIGGRRQEVRFFDNRDVDLNPDLLPPKDDDQESKKQIVHRLYDCAHNLIQTVYVQNQQLGSRSAPRLRREPVRRTMSDVPMGSTEADRLSGPKPRYRVRKVTVSNYSSVEESRF
ncbi:MAG: hypothetical protein Q9178_000248 [Gyalolechia marmorata]